MNTNLSSATSPLLEIRNLRVSFATRGGAFTAVDGLDLALERDETVAIVGESGSGKSVAMLAVMGLLPWTARVSAERLHFAGQDLRALAPRQRRGIIGRELAMIFQEPMSSLNPCFTVGYQIGEVLKVHQGLDRKQRRARAAELLDQVGIPDPALRLRAFPHQLSGGMCQRVMIAMALACKPRLLIADEPTTALDVTIQAQILDLLARLKRETGMGLVMITHDMGVVAEMADRVVVQYAGQPVEARETRALFADPHHPYTAALLAALPERAGRGAAAEAAAGSGARRLPALPGMVPGPFDRPQGCVFSPRCAFATAHCVAVPPREAGPDWGHARCHTPLRQGQPQPLVAGEAA
jgi:dipeptide transport system ATP-binding protein